MGILREVLPGVFVKKDLTGQKFGYWNVIRCVGRAKRRHTMWLCRCVCGCEKAVAVQHLTMGASKSCGCKSAGLRGVKGEQHYNWKGGIKNIGSLAWCAARIDSLRQGRKRGRGGADIASTPEDVQQLWEQSKGTCVACGRTPESTRELHLDHEKSTGIARGFVCGTCNVAIGMAGDSPVRLRQLAEYLEVRTA